VLGTNYYDWFFGLRRLFAEGMRPEYVLLGLSPNQLASSDVRGDITARYMVQQADLLDIVRQTHMDATRGSEFILAHYSEYYSTREITRGYIMSRVLPSVGELLHGRYASVRDPEIGASVLKPLAASRLAALDKLCRSYGARLLFVVPPSYQKGAEIILVAGQERGVTVLVPVKDNGFDVNDYQSDGVHMNEKGAQIFTTRLADSLNKELPD
jgi:lysophospholipase L1-like esterase